MGWLLRHHRFLTTVAAIATAAGTLALAVAPLFHKNTDDPALTKTDPSFTSGPGSEAEQPNENLPKKGPQGATRTYDDDEPSEAQIRLAELFSRRAFNEIIATSTELFPDAAFRTRYNVYLMQGEIDKAEQELNLDQLRKSGYPDNIQDGYYRGWPILQLQGDVLIVKNRSGSVVAEFDVISFLGARPGKVWTYRAMKTMRSLISAYEGQHSYCCLHKFLIDGYAPDDALRMAELDLLHSRFEEANRRLNLLRLIDWEADFTEVELLSVTGSLLEGDLESAEAFATGKIEGFDVLRYGQPHRSFLELALSLNRADFSSRLSIFRSALREYTPKYPYYLHDGWVEQPVLEKWLANLPESDRSRDLREAWLDLKSVHGMADLYSYMFKSERN